MTTTTGDYFTLQSLAVYQYYKHYSQLLYKMKFQLSHEDLTTPNISSYFGTKGNPSNINMAEQLLTASAIPWMNLKDEMIQSMKEVSHNP